MSKITAIKKQERKDRFNVYVDEKFSFALSAKILLEKGLVVGQKLSKEEIQALKYEEAVDKLYNQALRFLSYRPRSKKEVNEYLLKKNEANDKGNVEIIIAGRKPRTFSAGMNDRKAIFPRSGILLRRTSFCEREGNLELEILPAHESLKSRKLRTLSPQKLIDLTIAKLESLGLVDDKEFAKWWWDQRKQFRPKGIYALKQELYRKGISQDIIAQLLSSSTARQTEMEGAKKAVWKKIRSLESFTPREIRKKLTSFLIYRGFSYETIKLVLDETLGKR